VIGGEPGIIFTTVAERVAWNLRLARQKADLTQRGLALRMGCNHGQVSAWEGGNCCPKVNSLVRISEALDVDPGVLLRETKGLAS
jgi:transcriptional regulator with XRE-family HTH domain